MSTLNGEYLPDFGNTKIDAEDKAGDVDVEYANILILTLPWTLMLWACSLNASDRGP